MRLITFEQSNQNHVGLVTEQGVIDLTSSIDRFPRCMTEVIERWEELKPGIAAAAPNSDKLNFENLKLAAPIRRPGKVICIGLNYADHAAESGSEIPFEPVVFNKFPTAVIAHQEPIEIPGNSKEVDYEAELVVVIGKTAKNVSQSEAMSHVFGYCCGHDVSARDWQKGRPGGQWLLGKTFDTFAPLGPEIVTADEIDEPGNLNVVMRLNGETMQDSNTKQLIFPIDHLIKHLSSVSTLYPGDVIYTGTPPGVGAARKPPVFMKAGDVAEVEIEGLGRLTNPCIDGPSI